MLVTIKKRLWKRKHDNKPWGRKNSVLVLPPPPPAAAVTVSLSNSRVARYAVSAWAIRPPLILIGADTTWQPPRLRAHARMSPSECSNLLDPQLETSFLVKESIKFEILSTSSNNTLVNELKHQFHLCHDGFDPSPEESSAGRSKPFLPPPPQHLSTQEWSTQ